MAATEQEVIEAIITFLEANLTDPLSRGKKWIYDDLPRLDLSSYPRIAVTGAGSNYEELGINQTSQIEEMTLVVEVYTRKQDKITINSITNARAEQIVDQLTKDIKNLVKTNKDNWITEGMLYLRPETTNRSYIDDKIVQRTTFVAGVIN